MIRQKIGFPLLDDGCPMDEVLDEVFEVKNWTGLDDKRVSFKSLDIDMERNFLSGRRKIAPFHSEPDKEAESHTDNEDAKPEYWYRRP